MTNKLRWAAWIFSALALTPALGRDRYFARSGQGLLMGDAYTALATDEYSLFYNPALLGRHRGFSFWPINPGFTATDPLSDEFKSLSDPGEGPVEIAETLMNKPIHIGIGAAPGFKMGRFGLSAIYNHQTNVNVVNKTSPMLDIDHHYDRGFIMGYALPRRLSAQETLSFGFGVKYVERKGLYGLYNVASPSTVDAINGGDVDEILSSLGSAKDDSWGYDFGVDYTKRSQNSSFSLGLALLDVYTNFEGEDQVSKLQGQPMKVNAGAAYTVHFGAGFNFTLSADIRNLEQEMEFMRRLKMGVEVGLTPALSIMAGVNSGQYSYGATVDTGILRLTAGLFGADIGEKLGDQVSRRLGLYISLLDFTFDG